MPTIDAITRPLEYLSPLDRLLGPLIRRWADEQVIPLRRRFDEDWQEHRLIEPAFHSLMAELGLQRLLFPRELGGLGLAGSAYLGSGAFRIFEEVARADSGMAVAFGVTFWPLIMICTPPHQNRRLMAELAPRFCQGERACFAANAMTEPQGGADIENLDLLRGSTISTTARREGEEWVVSGHKLWPTNTGGVAELLGVVCTTRPGSDDPADFALIFVPGDAPGVTQGPPYAKAGMAADKNGDIWLEEVRVPAFYRACGPGDDFTYFKEVIAFGNLGSIAFVSGALLALYELLQRFCAEVRIGGRAPQEHDAVAGVLADIVRDVEMVRIVGYQYARMLDRPDLYGPRWSEGVVARGRALKALCCDRAMEDLALAMDLFEERGAQRSWDLEKMWRDLKIVQLWMGGKQLCQAEVARYFFDAKTL